jgi:hypothetical protein
MEKETVYTREEVANILKVSQEDLLKIFAYGINSPGPPLTPSVYIRMHYKIT